MAVNYSQRTNHTEILIFLPLWWKWTDRCWSDSS